MGERELEVITVPYIGLIGGEGTRGHNRALYRFDWGERELEVITVPYIGLIGGRGN